MNWPCWHQLTAENHLSDLRSMHESISSEFLHENTNEAIVGNGRLHYHNEVYFWPDSWAARAAPRRAPRRPGAFASAVSNSFAARPADSAAVASSRAVRGLEGSAPVSLEASRSRPPHRLPRASVLPPVPVACSPALTMP